MGQTLSEPITEKHSRRGGTSRQRYGFSEMQGWRVSMEDANATILEFEERKNVGYFAVYDGHGGVNVARYVGEHLHKRVISDPEFEKGNYGKALKNGFLGIDEDLQGGAIFGQDKSGCTAVGVLIIEEKDPDSDNNRVRIICGNAGDSRCVLSRNGQAMPLSYDHKPSNQHEIARIMAAGGFVQYGRVNANLALSRAIGDFDYKQNRDLPPEEQIVTANPDVIETVVTEEDEFLILACDGIWDVLSSQEAVDFVRARIREGHELDVICEKLMDRCLAKDPSNGIGCDNMTVIIVALTLGDEEGWKTKCQKTGNSLNEIVSELSVDGTAVSEESKSKDKETITPDVTNVDEASKTPNTE